jgi:hypothetical protein
LADPDCSTQYLDQNKRLELWRSVGTKAKNERFIIWHDWWHYLMIRINTKTFCKGVDRVDQGMNRKIQ